MNGTFEARLGLARNAGDRSDRSTTSSADGTADEIDGCDQPEHENVVLVVMDVNKELNLTALNWALAHVVQSGDTVKLLGVLHHIVNPMGYRSRADENSWNGANRKVLEHQIATHVAILKSVPAIYTAVEKLGAKLDIGVRANPHSKNLVVDEARRLGVRYVVIDRTGVRNMQAYKKDKKFYIEELTCYVTRVKTMTIFEHLRHGVPVVEDEAQPATQNSNVQTYKSLSNPDVLRAATETSSAQTCRRFSNPNVLQATLAPVRHQPQARFNIGNTAVPSCRPTNFSDYPVYDSPGVKHGYRMEPGFHYPAQEYGYMTTGYSPEAGVHHQVPMAMSPFTEAAMANLYTSNSYASLPPLYSEMNSASSYHGSHSAGIPQATQSHLQRSMPASSQTVQYQMESENATAQLVELQLREKSPVETQEDVNFRKSAPVSVQARRAHPFWPLELLHPDFGGHQISPSSEKADSKGQDDVARARQAGSSKKPVVPGTPPLCTVCQQKSPVFGKVKRFTYVELQDATDHFSGENYLAKDGYGTVYKGRLKRGQLVAVKQHKLSSSQGDEEFCAEVEMLNCAQHRNLVTLIGYCVERRMRLLVYEYVCNGSLDRHISPKSKTDLQWHYRHKIALGAARALRYLHEECRVGCIVHRDMRPNNILLTHDFTPMVGDFGLARRQSCGDLAEETRVLGTIGYLAPEYAQTGHITDKADVYAFGVVLLELLSGRKSLEHHRPKHEVSLVEWAQPLLASYNKELLDPRLKGQYNEYELHCMMNAATQCIQKDPCKRPRMTQVLRMLNPPQEEDWAYEPGRPIQETLSNSHTPQPNPKLPLPSMGSSGSSPRSSSCSV